MNRRAPGAGRLRPRTRPTDNHEVIVRALSVAVSAAVLAFGLGAPPDRALDGCGDRIGMPPLPRGAEVWRYLVPRSSTDEEVELVSVEPAELPPQIEWVGAAVYDPDDTDGVWTGWYDLGDDVSDRVRDAPSVPVSSWTLAPAGSRGAEDDLRYVMAKFRIAEDAAPGTYQAGALRYAFTVDGRRGEQHVYCPVTIQVSDA